MKIQLQPNTINNISEIALAAGFDITGLDVTIEYLNGGSYGQKVFLSNSSMAPTMLSGDEGQGVLICDESPKSVRSTLGVDGNSVYAWFKATNVEPITVLMG